ncbi:maltoporin LamB [Marinobacter sp. BGYM27]|uniref:maltoporin LamB n=1 Tax=Marinobacter sp. BGYM27 TaxID=2975597 RepID=UPI0021A9434E|nr:maltoporin LamB [Marinobacter sp. BGYM27]MDG5500583.1 maltoporin LamB [Marinobacter sp. BGYM27]
MMQNNNRLITRLSPLTAAIATIAFTTPAAALDFNGYARAGASTNLNSGGEQTCFGSGAGGHYVGRLADECDTYAEIGLGDELYNENGKSFRFDSMVSYGANNQGNDFQSYSYNNDGGGYDGGDTSLRQLYISGKNVVDLFPGATLWAGKRYYQRHDVHQLDLYYLNNSGYGGGVENISAGPGQLSLAFTNHDNKDGTELVQNNKFDVRYAFPVGSSTLTLVGIYGMADLTDQQEDAGLDDEDGYFLTTELASGFMGGFNKFVLQYGADSMGFDAFENGGGGRIANNNTSGYLQSSWRILDHGVIKLGGSWDLGYSALYQRGEAHDSSLDDAERLSVVARPIYNWSAVSSTALEVGYDNVKSTGPSDKEDLQKVAIAQQWSAGEGYWARPVIRVYAAAFFGDQAEAARSGDGVDGDVQLGVQMEAWW